MVRNVTSKEGFFLFINFKYELSIVYFVLQVLLFKIFKDFSYICRLNFIVCLFVYDFFVNSVNFMYVCVFLFVCTTTTHDRVRMDESVDNTCYKIKLV